MKLHSLTLRFLLLSAVLLMTAAASSAGDPACEVGKAAPDFTLTDTEGKKHHLADYAAADQIVVLEWFNADCPFIVKHHKTSTTMNDLQAAYADQDVVWLAICSSAEGKQGNGLERNRQAREDYAMVYPILIDESGEVGRLYGAKTTPNMYVIDGEGVLRYQGAIDDKPSPYEVGETNYVAAALAALVAGEAVAKPETKPYGCSVKYAN